MGRTLTGVVKSDKADKTIVIAVHTRKTHPIYKKQYSKNTTFIAHDEKNEAKVGDTVTIVETRPISKRKRFTLQTINEKARVTHVETEPEAAKPEKTEPKTAPKAKKTAVKEEDK